MVWPKKKKKDIVVAVVVQSLSRVWLFTTRELQHARLPCPSLSPGVCSNPRPLSRWCHPTISSSVAPFSCPQSFPASGLFQWVGFPALQADSLLSEPPRYWRCWITCKQCLTLSVSYIDLWIPGWSVMYWMVGLLQTGITWGSLHVFPPLEEPHRGCD